MLVIFCGPKPEMVLSAKTALVELEETKKAGDNFICKRYKSFQGKKMT